MEYVGKHFCMLHKWRCVCGKYIYATPEAMGLVGPKANCGCCPEHMPATPKHTNTDFLVGTKVGKVRITHRWGSTRNAVYWLGVCDCGNHIIISRVNRRTRKTEINCGCEPKVRAKQLSEGEAGLKNLYKQYRAGATDRNYDFTISLEQFKTLTSSNCAYCGASPSRKKSYTGARRVKYTATNSYAEYLFNGLDRVNNDIGYIEGNVVPCCHQCNLAKHQHTVEDFIAWVLRAAAYIRGAQKVGLGVALAKDPNSKLSDNIESLK
jgi:hypothetical protein